MIFLQLEAESLDELRLKAIQALGLLTSPPAVDATPTPEDRPAKAFREALASKAKEAKAAKKAKAPETDEEARKALINNEDPRSEAPGEVEQPEPDLASTPLIDSLANEKLKTDTIAKLGALFAAGKVKVVRSALDKYGMGAKSFPEIDASQFPAIAAALDRGDIA